MSYQKDLLNPKWIAKRNKILKRDGHRCIKCGAEKHLQVHHTFYYKNKIAPWLYPEDSLWTLCRVCHKQIHMVYGIIIKPNPLSNKPSKKKKERKKKTRPLAKIQTSEPVYRPRKVV